MIGGNACFGNIVRDILSPNVRILTVDLLHFKYIPAYPTLSASPSQRQKIMATVMRSHETVNADARTVRQQVPVDILEHPDITHILKMNASISPGLVRAGNSLTGRSDAVPALKKAASALINNKIDVFFSYKFKNQAEADKIVRTLRKNSAGKLNVTYAGDFKEKNVGELWQRNIRESINKAHWLILLLPDPSDDWDWCLFETGYFRGQMVSGDRLICLHPENTAPPPQIGEFHAVEGTQEKLEGFVKQVFVNEDPTPGMDAINLDLDDEDVSEIATELHEAINRPKECMLTRTHFDYFMMLKFEALDDLETVEQLKDAKIIESNTDSVRIFGYNDIPATFGGLLGELDTGGDSGVWMKELLAVIVRIGQGKTFNPIQSMFRSPEDGKVYRPIVHSVHKQPDGSIERFHIIFVEELGLDLLDMPGNVTALATGVRSAFRFRWEVLERFSARPFGAEGCVHLAEAIHRIEVEAETRGILTPDRIKSEFNAEGAASIQEMYDYWATLRNADETGRLDSALKNKNTKEIEKILDEIAPLNKQFLDLVTRRFAEVQ